MCEGGEAPELFEGYWEPEQLATYLGKSRQTVVDAINDAGKHRKFPRRLFAEKFGQYLLIPDPEARAYIHWVRSGELLPEARFDSKRLWTLGEVATRVGVSISTLSRLLGVAGSGRPLTGSKLHGKIWLVPDAQAVEFIEQYFPERRSE